MTVSLTKKPAVAAIKTDDDILREAAEALHTHDVLRRALRDTDKHLLSLCRQYEQAVRVWLMQPHHLRQACEARGLLPLPRIG